MSIDTINKIYIPLLILDKKFRVLRHLLLLFVIITILHSISLKGEYINEYAKLIETILSFISFSGIIYLNMYVCVSRLLLKNKTGRYLLTIVGCSLFLVFIMIFSQFTLHKPDLFAKKTLTNSIINTISAFIVVSLINICTTSFVLFRNYILNSQQITELSKETLKIELQQLKNQINPHFLFNMLNNANIMVKQNPEIASHMLLKLDKLLNYQIEDSSKDDVLLNKDISFLKGYLELEKTRRDRFDYSLLIEGNTEELRVPPFLFLPFVENAVKHSPDNKNLSFVNISFKIKDKTLDFSCINSKPDKIIKKKGGLGLANIKRRLELLYDKNYSLKINETETTYTVFLCIKL